MKTYKELLEGTKGKIGDQLTINGTYFVIVKKGSEYLVNFYDKDFKKVQHTWKEKHLKTIELKLDQDLDVQVKLS